METMAFHAIHSGLILKEELAARGLGATAFGLKLRVPPQRIQEIVGTRRAITLEDEAKLCRAGIRRSSLIAACALSPWVLSPILLSA